MAKVKEISYGGLCHRCDHRATFLESGGAYRPRYECGTGGAVYGCYMYKPCRPVITKGDGRDKRPRFAGAMLSAREYFDRVAEKDVDVEAVLTDLADGKAMIYWKPIRREVHEKTTKKEKRGRKAVAYPCPAEDPG